MKLTNIQIQNFKAITNSKSIKLGDLNVFVGHNGSGKSSLIEALETYQTFVGAGLDFAMQRFMGIEHVKNKHAKPDASIGFELGLRSGKDSIKLKLKFGTEQGQNRYDIREESFSCKARAIHRTLQTEAISLGRYGASQRTAQSMLKEINQTPDERQLGRDIALDVLSWQFLSLAPEGMGIPRTQQRSGGRVLLARDGSNIAEFLLDLREQDPRALEGIIRTMSYVLPYARDLQPAITSELERKAWLQLTEGEFKVPGWMLSTGTLRVLALLALLRHPQPPPLLVIEEIENGLDPRSIHLLVEEIRTAVQSGRTQVILTTHSPYLLDLLKLEHLVLVARNEAGEPKFHRPASDANLQEWAKEFAPGRLYTMGSLHGAVE
jgi:predicted ATPase